MEAVKDLQQLEGEHLAKQREHKRLRDARDKAREASNMRLVRDLEGEMLTLEDAMADLEQQVAVEQQRKREEFASKAQALHGKEDEAYRRYVAWVVEGLGAVAAMRSISADLTGVNSFTAYSTRAADYPRLLMKDFDEAKRTHGDVLVDVLAAAGLTVEDAERLAEVGVRGY